MNQKYIFTGVIHPQRADVNFPNLKGHVNDTFIGIEGVIETSAYKSLITVIFETENESLNILDLRNLVRNVVSLRAHYLGFTNGCGYEVEIDRVIFPDSKVLIFGVNFPALQNIIENSKVSDLEYLNIIGGESSPFVSIILSDFNKALIDSKNLPFYCYRSIEAIMQFFRKDQKEEIGWVTMRETLQVVRDDIEYVKERGADVVRHGAPLGITDRECVEAVTKTWDIIFKFFEYLSQSNKGTK